MNVALSELPDFSCAPGKQAQPHHSSGIIIGPSLAYLDRAYDDLERRRLPLLGGATKTLRHLRRFRVDVAKLTDEVTHITKFFGDWHLARVYLGARDRFYLDQWRASVEQRLAQLDKLYSVVHTELNERRMLWLEIIIVIFFAIDLLILLWVRR